MSRVAIVSCLWQKNIGVLESYAKRHPGINIISPSVYLDKAGEERLRAAGAHLVALEQLLPAAETEHLSRLASDLLGQVRQGLGSAAWAEQCARHGWDAGRLTPVVAARAEAEAGNFTVLTEALARARASYDICLVVVNEDLMPIGRIVTEWARAVKVPSLVLSHSLLLFRDFTVHDRIHADVMALFGERGAEGYLDAGCDPARMRVIGNPAWDQYLTLKNAKSRLRAEVAEQFKLDPAKPIVVFGTTWAANLSARGNEKIYGKTLGEFFSACRTLRQTGLPIQPIIKDRFQNAAFSHTLIPALAREHGLEEGSYAYAVDGIERLIVAADVVVSIDSNMSVEAMMAGTPAINLTTEFGIRLGPCFGAESGVVESEADDLPGWLEKVLTDTPYRQSLLAAMQARVSYFNVGVDGSATLRMVALMEDMALTISGESQKRHIWQTLLNVSDSDTNQYHNWVRSDLVEMVKHAPRVVLDIGCGAGATGDFIKKKYPGSRVIGIEVNQGAAKVAATRIDQVLTGKFEDFDLEAEGIAKGSVDTVIVADVLEHMYDPWGVLYRLKPYLTPDAQVLASIPNIRNLVVMGDLAKGYWTYDSWGLLDITHIRFFTLREIRRFFQETGYRIARLHHNMDSRLMGFYEQHKDKTHFNVELEKITLRGLTRDELIELCTWQFFVVAEPGALSDEEFAANEKALSAEEERKTGYQAWQGNRRLNKAEAALFEERMKIWGNPLVHLVLYANPADVSAVGETLKSLAEQQYFNVHATVVATFPAPSGWQDSERLAWRYAPEPRLLSTARQVLLEKPAQWIGLMDAGDRLSDISLLFMLEMAHEHPEWQLMYSDEDVQGEDGECELPHFKPDFNLDMLRSFPYTGGLLLMKQTFLRDLDCLHDDSLGVEEYDLMLRAYEKAGAAGIGHVPGVMYHRRKEGGHCRKAVLELLDKGCKALEAHLARQGVAAGAEKGLFPGSYRVRYRHEGAPRVSILVAVRGQLSKLQRLIESILVNTAYPDFEVVLLDNGSADVETRNYLQGVQAIGDPRLKVFGHAEPAPLPRLHNLLAAQASGEYLLFLHYDSAILQADWLDALMAHARRSEVGCVAPRLLNPDGAVRQTGMVLGMAGSVGTVFSNQRIDYPGYFGHAHLEQNFSALGGGCFLTRKSAFQSAGGFDEQPAMAEHAEIDYCLKLRGHGYLHVWTPYVSLLCEGGAAARDWSAAGDDVTEFASGNERKEAFLSRWLKETARDPAYNPHLALDSSSSFTVETRRPLIWDPLTWKPLPKVLAHPADDGGCGEYRIFAPMRALTEAGKIHGWSDFHIFTAPEMERLDVDSLVVQRQTSPEQLEALARHKKFARAFRVYELDDLITHLPSRSVHNEHMPKDVGNMLRKGVALCDRFVVSTVPLAEAFRDMHSDIRVVHNYIEGARWNGLNPSRRQGNKPRVGWAGGVGHSGDLEVIADVVKALAKDVDWVFLGMCPEPLREYVKEFHLGVPVAQYPAKLASLNLDLALAPLELHPFNEGKSHLRLLEYGVLGYPVICTDIYPYQGDYPVKRVKNRFKDWMEAIQERLADLDACAREGDALRDYVRGKWMLEDNLDAWLKAWLP